MVIATQVVFALVVALLISFIISFALKREGPRTGFFLMFLSVFLITLAGGLWLQPPGVDGSEFFWLPFIVVGALGSYILYLRAPRRPPHSRRETIETLDRIAKSKQLEKLTYFTFDLLFWVLLVFLLAIILVHYFRKF